MIPSLINVSLSDADTRLLTILLIVLVVLFLLVGLLGMFIRWMDKEFAKRLDAEVHDAVVYRVIQNPKDLWNYGYVKNNRVFFKQLIPPVVLGLVSLLFFLVYAGATSDWNHDFWGDFSTLFYNFDWSNPSNYATLWGINLLARWPQAIEGAGPYWDWSYWPSYVLCPLWIASGVYFVIDVQAYVSRLNMLRRRRQTVFDKNLEGYNFYDHMPIPPSFGPKSKVDKEAKERK